MKSQEEKLTDLMMMSVRHNMTFSYSGRIGGISIDKFIRDEDGEHHSVFNASGYIKNWKWETPDKTLDRLTQEVLDYVDRN